MQLRRLVLPAACAVECASRFVSAFLAFMCICVFVAGSIRITDVQTFPGCFILVLKFSDWFSDLTERTRDVDESSIHASV